jgi:hypothetical protein
VRDEPPPGVCDIWVARSHLEEDVDARGPAADVRTTSRALQRVAMAAYMGVAPHELTIDRTCTRCGDRAHGRPTVTSGPVYSVTRTESFVALAAVAEGMVGVDAEQERTREDLAEIATLLGLPLADASTTLTAWVRQEAALKARGAGIVDLWPAPTDATHGLEVVDLDLPGAVLALATSRPVQRVRWTEVGPGAQTVPSE